MYCKFASRDTLEIWKYFISNFKFSFDTNEITTKRCESVGFLNKKCSKGWPCRKGNEGRNCVDSFVGKPHEYVVRARILWFEYANTAWKLRIVSANRKTARSSYTFLFGIGDTNKIVPPVRKASIPRPTVRPSQVRSDNQPSVPHPRVHSPIRWADWLSRLWPWGGQTRLTGCHGDLMDWSEQISSPKTPERIAGFQRIALASAHWVSFVPSSFVLSFFLSQAFAYRTVAHALSGKKNENA